MGNKLGIVHIITLQRPLVVRPGGDFPGISPGFGNMHCIGVGGEKRQCDSRVHLCVAAVRGHQDYSFQNG